MSGKKVWFCANCGYEVNARGRCFLCHQRLVASPLPQLAPQGEEEEVGYRLDDWDDAGRGRMIVALIRANIAHRFEDDELVVGAGDESRVDDLLAELTTVLAAEGMEPDTGEVDVVAGDAEEEPDADEVGAARAALEALYAAATRLEEDPTDMQADGDVAEASATVFSHDQFPRVTAGAWAAVGRTTRRLLGALGAEEAMEDEIKAQAAELVRLLRPVVDPAAASAGEDANGGGSAGDEIVYELPEWSPGQREELIGMLQAEGIGHSWDGGDLVVAADREADVDAIFDAVGAGSGAGGDDGGEARYRALEELFAAADRLVNDPGSETKRADAAAAVAAADGGTPLGMADVEWWQLRAGARRLADSINQGAASSRVHDDAQVVRDLLRSIV